MHPAPFVIYRASAGTGKTYTLVQEFLKLALNNPALYQKILAITFTNKAAAEMKERVLKNLRGIIETPNNQKFSAIVQELMQTLNLKEQELQKKAQDVLTNILHDYSNFSICTIDSFTSKIVKTFAREIGFQPNFNVELDSDFFIKKAIDIILAKVGQDKNITTVLTNFVKQKLDDEKSYNIETDLYNFIQQTWKESGIDEQKKLEPLSIESIIESENTIEKRIGAIKKQIQDIAKPVVDQLDTNGYMNTLFQKDKGIAGYLMNAKLFQKTPSSNSYVNNSIENDIWQTSSAQKSHPLSDSLKNEIRNAYQSIENLLKDYNLFQIINKKIFSVALFNEIQRTINELYDETGKVFIAEFNKRIADIISNEPIPFIYERVGSKYEHFFIDEFQDTSDLQWNNLAPLIANATASQQFNMIVGDGKQAIYRWRNGNVELFEHLSSLENKTTSNYSWGQNFLKQTHTETLQTNYRSDKAIIDFNNELFDYAKDFWLGKQAPNLKNVYEDQLLNVNSSAQDGYVQIQFLQNPDKEKNSIDELVFKEILGTIRKLQDNHYQLGDIAVLCRKNATLFAISDYLTTHGIPISSSESLRLNQHADVNLLCSLIRYSDDNESITDKMYIIWWVLQKHHQTEQANNIWQQINSADDLQKWLKKHDYTVDFQKILELPLLDIVFQLILDFKLDISNLYIRFFVDSIMDIVQKEQLSLFGFSEWWSSKGEKLSLSVSDTSNAVQMLSIHKAKGLEFPIVILPVIQEGTLRTSEKIWVSLDQNTINTCSLPVALVPLSKELEQTDFAHLYKEEKGKNLLDVLNLLYVACTRPKNALFIFGEQQTKPSAEPSMSTILQGFIQKQNATEVFYKGSFPKTAATTIHTSLDDAQIKSSLLNNNQPFTFTLWKEKIDISHRNYQTNPFFENDHTQYGKLMHAALETIITAADIQPSVNRLVQSGSLSDKDAAAFTERLTKIVEHPILQPFFSPTSIILNENDILFPHSISSLRPDRIAVMDNQTTIIDYKTGKPAKEHIDQVQKYGTILRQMGYNVSQGLLVYITKDQIEVEPVNMQESF